MICKPDINMQLCWNSANLGTWELDVVKKAKQINNRMGDNKWPDSTHMVHGPIKEV